MIFFMADDKISGESMAALQKSVKEKSSLLGRGMEYRRHSGGFVVWDISQW